MPFDANEGDVSRFLHVIEQLESSGGTNLNHPTMQNGIHAGDAAQGRYAIMPNTQEEFQRRTASVLTPDETAPLLAKRVLDRANGDEGLAAAMYQYGHNLDVSNPKIVDKLKSTDRYSNYNNLRNKQIPLAVDPNPYGDRLQQMNGDLKNEADAEPTNRFNQLKTMLQPKP